MITFGSNAYQKSTNKVPVNQTEISASSKQPSAEIIEQPIYTKISKGLQFLLLLHVLIFNNVAFCCRVKKSDRMNKFIKSSLKCLILSSIFMVINNLLIFGTIFTREITFWNGNLVTILVAFSAFAVLSLHKSPLLHTVTLWLILTFVR